MRFSLTSLLLASSIVPSAFAASTTAKTPQVNVGPTVRITGSVDKTVTTTLSGSIPGKVAVAKETGRLAGNQQISHLVLVLKSTDAQEAALQNLMDQQQDKGSPYFHAWMTPATFATTFGVAQADIAKVAAWLGDAGLSVDAVSAGGRFITFSGSASAIEGAFSTELHTYSLNGDTRFSNSTEISIPTALASVVAGPARLNNFAVKANAVNPHPMVKGKDGNFYPVVPGTTDTPDYTSLSSGSHYVGPYDASTIFNAAPLKATGIDGTGITIGVIGQSTISLSNVETFRSLFNLPLNDPKIVNVGPVPAIIADDIESDLDVEWAGALATGAKVLFATSGGSLYDGGVDTSALYLVDGNIADILSLSYGGCEVSNGSGGTAYWNTLWEQAAAQGQSVFVSTGDSSATGCTSSSATTAGAAGTYGVNALGSSAYNVAVGGTGFYEGPTIAFQTGPNPYWGVGGVAPYGTALSYVPEVVWSEGAFDIITQGSGVAGSGGGVSVFTGRPSWQTGVGISPTADPAGPTFTASGAIPATQLHRLVPDLAGIAAGGHDGTIFCSEGVCKINSDGTVGGIGVVGGTSVATPTTAGMQALIDQANGGRQGNANYFYYKLAAAEPSIAACAATIPTGATVATAPASTCNFHDVVTGYNYSPKDTTGKYNVATGTISGTLGTDYVGFPATTGFDEATGLGSPNVTNLANNWSSVTFNSTTTTLTLDKTSVVHGTTINATITVAANSSTAPVPTGLTSIVAVGQTTGIDGNFYTLSAGTATAALQQLPGGTYNVYAHYAGDAIDAASNSAPVSVTITKEPSTTFLTSYNITTAGAVNNAAIFTYGTSIYLDTDVQGNSATGLTGNSVLNTGNPTGGITYVISSAGVPLTAPPVENLDTYGTTYLEIGQTFTNFLIYANYPAIPPGPYYFGASYPGDNSFGPSSASTSLTVVKASVTPTLTVSTADITSGGTAQFGITIGLSGGGVYPTGTATITDTTTNTVLGTSSAFFNGSATFSTNSIVSLGGHTITATYSGDTNYNSTTSTGKTITVISGTAPAITVTNTSTVSPLQVLNTVSLTATLASAATVTTTVAFYDGTTRLLGTANITTGTTAVTVGIATLTAGVHSITASTAGTAAIPSVTSAPLAVTILQNTPIVVLTSQQANTVDGSVNMNAVLTPTPAAPGTAAGANPAPTLIMSFYDGTTLLGTAPIIHTANYLYYTAAFSAPVLGVGTHTLTARYLGDANYAGATSNVQTVTIAQSPTTTTVSTATTNIGVGIPFAISSTVTPLIKGTAATTGTYPTVTGTVTFKDGATTIGTGTLVNGSVTANATLTTLGSSHTITAVYSGDANYLGSTSSVLTTTITSVTPNFTLSASPTTLVIQAGNSANVTLTSVVTGNYNGYATLNCSGLPAYSYCSFTAAALTFNGSNATQTATMTISTTQSRYAGFFWIPALLLAGFLGMFRRRLTVRGRQLMLLAILSCGLVSASGCSNGVHLDTPNSTSTVTIYAAGFGSTSASPNITPTATISVQVTN